MSVLELLLMVAVVVAIVKVVRWRRGGNPDGIKPDYWGAIKVLAEQYRVILLGLAGLVAAFGVLALIFFLRDALQDEEPRRTVPATTTKPVRPPYCEAYDKWAAADAERGRIEAQQPSTNVNDWPSSALQQWTKAIEDMGVWGPRAYELGARGGWAKTERDCR